MTTEIETRRRLRLICKFFQDLNNQINPKGRDWSGTKMPAGVAAIIQDKEFDPDDLMAIRQAPHKWGTHTLPETWLWLLHRYMNHYSK